MKNEADSAVHIIGAGGLGRDLVACFRNEVKFAGWWDDQAGSENIIMGLPVLGTLSDLEMRKSPVSFVIAVGNPEVRSQIAARLRSCGHKPVSVIHSQANLYNGETIRVGSGTIIFPGVHITTDVDVSDNCVIHIGASLHHNVLIGSCSVIMPRVVLAGNVTVGERVYISPGKTYTHGANITSGTRE